MTHLDYNLSDEKGILHKCKDGKRVRKSERRRKREEIEESMRENERNCTFSSGPQRPIGQVGPWPYQYLSTPKFKNSF